jgi:ketosteroid isomerase-like protein
MPGRDDGAIVRAVFAAYVAKDRAAIERLIGPDFHFTSPLDNRIDRETYFERCWPNSERIEDFDFVRFMAREDQVAVTYEARSTGGKRFRNTEIFTLRGDQVAEVEVYFGWSLPHPASAGGFVDHA